MRSRRLLIALTVLLFLLQASAIFASGMASDDHSWVTSIQASLVVSCIIGAVDIAVVRYLIGAVRRSEAAYAAHVSGQLEEALDGYRIEAEQDELIVQEASAAIEQELAQAREALRRGDFSTTSSHLQASLDLASSTKTLTCACIPVAAVLESKTRSCAAVGVTLDAKASLPDELPIDDVELASIFFNLIDNALHECEALAKETDTDVEHTITVRANTLAGQVFVEVTNPCREGAEAKLHTARRHNSSSEQHGWGVEIVQDIVRKHEGISSFTEQDGRFSAKVMLPLHDGD